jgi:hypothetical protein
MTLSFAKLVVVDDLIDVNAVRGLELMVSRSSCF